MNFLEKYQNAREEKRSILCIGLDPATSELRKENVIPERYQQKEIGEGILNFCLDIMEETANYASCVKVNSQYVLFLLGVKELKKLTDKAHNLGMVAILDHKLGDISDSNLPAFFWAKEAGFDALTFSPFAGNIEEATLRAHQFNLGIFVLTLMSNPEAVWLQKEGFYDKKPLYQEIARKVNQAKADGLVVGATGQVSGEDLRVIRKISGPDSIFLCPGVGFQGGDLKKLILATGKNLLINVGRAIIYTQNPGEKAHEFSEKINRYYEI